MRFGALNQKVTVTFPQGQASRANGGRPGDSQLTVYPCCCLNVMSIIVAVLQNYMQVGRTTLFPGSAPMSSIFTRRIVNFFVLMMLIAPVNLIGCVQAAAFRDQPATGS